MDMKASEGYFRGRKLKSHVVELPEGYRGVVVQRDDSAEEVGDTGDDRKRAMAALQIVSEISEVVVWDHEGGGHWGE